MLIGRCSSQLSGHRKLKKSQPLSGAPHRLIASHSACARSRRTSAVLVPPMLFGAFQPPSRDGAAPPRPSWKDIPVTIVCVSQEILLSGFGGRKAPNSMGETSTAEVLRLRAQALCHAINLRGASLRMTSLWENQKWL
jgi:hypothetical protein